MRWFLNSQYFEYAFEHLRSSTVFLGNDDYSGWKEKAVTIYYKQIGLKKQMKEI